MYGPKAGDGGVIVSLKLSQAELFALSHWFGALGGMTAPVQVTLGFDSDTVAEVGSAPRVIGMTTSATATTDKQSNAARASLNRMTVDIDALASLLNISESLRGYWEPSPFADDSLASV